MKKISFEQVKLIEEVKWSEFVSEIYNRPYRFRVQNGCMDIVRFRFSVPDDAEDFSNKTIPEILNGDERGVSFSAWLERDPKILLKDQFTDILAQCRTIMWWERKFYPKFQMVANDLHKRGMLDAGDYLINIDW
jgi:hypothetical protein